MAETGLRLTARPALGGVDRRIGGNRIVERSELALVSLAVPIGGEDAVAAALERAFGLAMPSAVQSVMAGDMRALRSAPDQVMLLFPHAAPDAEGQVRDRIADAGYTTDQSDAWVALEVAGPDTLAALERCCPLDTAAMAEGAAARTVMEHVGSMVVRLGPDRFLLLTARSSAGSFLEVVETSYWNVAG